jgi:6-phosphogluconolactonase
MNTTRRSLLQSAVPASLAATSLLAAPKPMLLYIGAYTNNMNKGITVAKFDPATGAISDMTLAAETSNPTFLELHPNGKWLYSICEISNFDGQKVGGLCAWSIDRATGKLTELNRVSTKGPGPCHVNLDRKGAMAMIANYGGGSTASFKILPDGKVSEAVSFFQHEGKGPVARRQDGPHAHSINPTPDDKYAVVCDLGTDEIRVYELVPSTGAMKPHKSVKLAPGSGPRHFAWHPNKRFGYSVNELASTVTAFTYLPGDLEEIHSVSTLPEGFKGQNTTAEIRVHPTGRWLYASNRGEDSIAAFSVDSKTGKIAPLGNTPTQGVQPRNFFIEPSGRWLLAANQKTNNVIVLEIDQKSGKLQSTGKGITVGQPVCLRTLA